MAEGTYEYECMRAELLGVDPPDYEEFLKKSHQHEQNEVDDEIVLDENIKDAHMSNESATRISGGLDELNSILQVTQRKINKFKASCGSLTNLLRIKMGQQNPSTSSSSSSSSSSSDDVATTLNGGRNVGLEEGGGGPGRKSDLDRALDNHVDRLDSLIDKAENAQYSMSHQNKEMKRFLH